MLSNDRLRLGPKVTLKLITSPSSSTPISASAMPGAPNVVPTPKEVNGPFRIWRQLSSGGFARAMGAEDVSSSRLLCLKVFKKTQLKEKGTEEGLLNEIQVYKRLESSKERCPGAIFLMALQRSFQTVNYICFAMVCTSPVRHSSCFNPLQFPRI
jgi:hypothetical protein